MSNVNEIVNNALCSGCGGCASTCSFDALSIKENASGYLQALIDDDKCTDCGACSRSCPVNHNFNDLYADPFYGNPIKGYSGYALNSEIRQKGQSGGVVTALLSYMLDNGMIEKALVNKYNNDNKKSDLVFVENSKDLLECGGSIYVQSAVCEELLKESKLDEVAAVTLGCQSQYLEMNNKKPKFNIGLICYGNYSRDYISAIIEKSNYQKDSISEFKFRDKRGGRGWPGDTTFLDGNKRVRISKTVRADLKHKYGLFRCISCFDQMNTSSDIVVGDPWGLNEYNKKEGYSIFIAYNQKSIQLIEDAIEAGYLYAENVELDDIYKGQGVENRTKNKVLTAFSLADRFNYKMPETKPIFEKEFINYSELGRRMKYTKDIMTESSIDAVKEMRKDKSILLIGVSLPHNLGFPSIISAFTDYVYSEYPYLKIDYVERKGNEDIKENRILAEKYLINPITLPTFKRIKSIIKHIYWAIIYRLKGSLKGNSKAKRLILKIAKYDLIIEMTGIVFTDKADVKVRRNISLFFPIILGKIIGKKCIKSTSAIGPIKNKDNKIASEIILKRCFDFVVARDNESKKICEDFGLKNVDVAPDTAFCMKPEVCDKSEEIKKLKEEMTIVGVSLSHQLRWRTPDYDKIIANVIKTIKEKNPNTHFLLIPNERKPRLDRDDRVVCEEIGALLDGVNYEIVDGDLLNPNEIKAVVGQCDIILASRYHTLIAALSQGIPSIALSWHHKYKEALKEVGMEKYVVENSEFKADFILNYYYELLNDKENISKSIKEKVPFVKRKVTEVLDKTLSFID